MLVATALALLTPSCGGAEPQPAPSSVTQAVVDEAVAAERAYDLQGHRGARGLRPENTLPGFELALDLLVDTLELDLHLAADDVVIVWHDPVVDIDKCEVDGPVPVRQLAAAELGAITCDRNPDPDRFPEQSGEPGEVAGDDYTIATLAEVFAFVADYSASSDKTDQQRANAASVSFNIETKRRPDDPAAIGDGFDGAAAGVFETALMTVVIDAGVLDRVTVQSFDHRSLWAIAAEYPDVALAALTRRNDIPDFDDLVRRRASIWSPDHRGVGVVTVEAAHSAGMLVIPWTVNDPGDMARLLELGVDGIITDRPDLAPTAP